MCRINFIYKTKVYDLFLRACLPAHAWEMATHDYFYSCHFSETICEESCAHDIL